MTAETNGWPAALIIYRERPRENNISVKDCIFVTRLSFSQVSSNAGRQTIGNNMVIQLYRVQAGIVRANLFNAMATGS